MTAIGPVQLLVLDVGDAELDGGVLAELGRLREADGVRLIDALMVRRDARGGVETRSIGGPEGEAAAGSGAVVEALLGLGAGGPRETADEADAPTEDEGWDVVGELPPGTAAAVLLLEHRWAIPLRDALHGAKGVQIADDWVHPLDLVAVGLIAAG